MESKGQADDLTGKAVHRLQDGNDLSGERRFGWRVHDEDGVGPDGLQAQSRQSSRGIVRLGCCELKDSVAVRARRDRGLSFRITRVEASPSRSEETERGPNGKVSFQRSSPG